MKYLSIPFFTLIVLCGSVFAENKIYTSPAAEKMPANSIIIRSVEDAKLDNAFNRAEIDIRARPIFEELNKELISDKNENTSVSSRTKPELLRPFEKK